MFNLVLILFLAALILALSVRVQRDGVDHRLTVLLLVGYALRLAIAPLTRTATLFASGFGGVDSLGYEGRGEIIAHLWRYNGVHYVTDAELPALAQVSLPPNVFAGVIYLNGGSTHLGCVAVVAALACFMCLDLHLLSLQLGVPRNVALVVTALISVLPSFLYYTADTYKEGFVAFFVLGIFGCSVRLAHKFSPGQLAWAVALLAGLWVTRFYLVFAMPAPLILGVLGLRSGSVMRRLLVGLVIGASVAATYAYSGAPATVTDHAIRAFDYGTSRAALDANADSASGVDFSAESSSFVPKLAYTLFAPFPWQSGSIGLQIGKLEAFVWYYFIYRGIRAGRIMWRERRSDLLMFVSFVVPMTVAYAFSFANIGLIVRHRMVVVLATIVLASLSWSAPSSLAVKKPFSVQRRLRFD